MPSIKNLSTNSSTSFSFVYENVLFVFETTISTYNGLKENYDLSRFSKIVLYTTYRDASKAMKEWLNENGIKNVSIVYPRYDGLHVEDEYHVYNGLDAYTIECDEGGLISLINIKPYDIFNNPGLMIEFNGGLNYYYTGKCGYFDDTVMADLKAGIICNILFAKDEFRKTYKDSSYWEYIGSLGLYEYLTLIIPIGGFTAPELLAFQRNKNKKIVELWKSYTRKVVTTHD